MKYVSKNHLVLLLGAIIGGNILCAAAQAKGTASCQAVDIFKAYKLTAESRAIQVKRSFKPHSPQLILAKGLYENARSSFDAIFEKIGEHSKRAIPSSDSGNLSDPVQKAIVHSQAFFGVADDILSGAKSSSVDKAFDVRKNAVESRKIIDSLNFLWRKERNKFCNKTYINNILDQYWLQFEKLK